MATKADAALVVAMISAAYPNFAASEMTTEVYYQTLKDIPSELLNAATLQSISEAGRKFAPSVGEIRGAVAEINRRVANVPTSYQAWQEVLQQMRAIGSWGEPTFTNDLIKRTVDVMGWKNLCMSENPVADRARFIQAYEQLQNRYEYDAMILPEVRGYIEANGGKLLAPSEQISLLADKWSGK